MNIGLLGIGTIGTGVYEQINRNLGKFADSVNIPSKITKILDKDTSKNVQDAILTTNPSDIMDDEDIEIVVALMGGSDFEYEQIKEALKHKKHVVTANKAVIGAHIDELTKLAKDNGVMLRYEASVGGGIPIIRELESQLKNNEIYEIKGILNGTTNYILTKMLKDRSDFTDALKEAQAIGFAEADPSADIEGDDVSRKIAILSSLAYGNVIKDEHIKKRGIGNVSPLDLHEAHRMGYKIKHLGQSINDEGTVSIVVEPVLFKKNSLMGNVDDEFNLVSIKGDVVGELQFFGKGAGKDATANAVVNDVMEIIQAQDENRIIPSPDFTEKIELNNNNAFHGGYYIRINENNSKNYSLSDIMEFIENVTEIKNINTSNGNIFIFTRDVESSIIDSLMEQLQLEPEELFYARICE